MSKMPPVASYVFADEWRVAAELEIVWTVLRRLEEWPDWWPSVRSQRLGICLLAPPLSAAD